MNSADEQGLVTWATVTRTAIASVAYAVAHSGDREPEQSQSLLEYAAENGNFRAKVDIGEAAAARGSVAGAFYLGCVLDDHGQTSDAEKWLAVAANAGHPAAMERLGMLHADRGNAKRAEALFRRAVSAGGGASARYNLAVCLTQSGRTAEAEGEFRSLAAEGHIDAAHCLGILLVDTNPQEAESWLLAAAEAGDPTATYDLGVLFGRQGMFEESEQWFRRASDAGIAEADTALRQLRDSDP